MTGKITLTLTVFVSGPNGGEISAKAVQSAAADTENAVRNRLFGEGYLPDDVEVEAYTISTSYVG